MPQQPNNNQANQPNNNKSQKEQNQQIFPLLNYFLTSDTWEDSRKINDSRKRKQHSPITADYSVSEPKRKSDGKGASFKGEFSQEDYMTLACRHAPKAGPYALNYGKGLIRIVTLPA